MNQDLTDDVPCVSLRSQRVQARSVKTEKRTKCGHSVRSREFPDGLTTLLRTQVVLAFINRVRQTAVVRIVLPEQSRVVHVFSGELYSTTSCGRFSLN